MQRAREASPSLIALRFKEDKKTMGGGGGGGCSSKKSGFSPLEDVAPEGGTLIPEARDRPRDRGPRPAAGPRWECRRKPRTLTFLIPEQELSRVTMRVGADPPGLPHGRGVEGGLVGAVPDWAEDEEEDWKRPLAEKSGAAKANKIFAVELPPRMEEKEPKHG